MILRVWRVWKAVNGMHQYEEQKRRIAEQLWLHYYNRVLYERGIIGEEERNRMGSRIDARAGKNFH